MRFVPSVPWRTVTRVMLTMAVVGVMGVVSHDLWGRAVKPEGASSTSGAVLSLEATSSPHVPKATVTYTGTPFAVCGNAVAPIYPWTIDTSSTYQALAITLGGACSISSTITYGPSLAAISVGSGGWISFQNVQVSNDVPAGAVVGPVSWTSGSNLEVVISPTLVPVATQTVVYPLLQSVGVVSCPSFVSGSGVTLTLTNCPVDVTLTKLGSYQCTVSAVSSYNSLYYISPSYYCNISLVIAGPLQLSSRLLTIQFCKQGSATFTQAMFATAIYTITGYGAAAIVVESWFGPCPYTVAFRVLGSNTALINTAVQTILYSANAGALGAFLEVTYAGVGYLLPEVLARNNVLRPCTCSPVYPPVTGPSSHSNPDLFGLLALLAIPALLVVGLFAFLYYASQPPTTPPASDPKVSPYNLDGHTVYPLMIQPGPAPVQPFMPPGPAMAPPVAPAQGFVPPTGFGAGTRRLGRDSRHGGDTDLASVPMYGMASLPASAVPAVA